ncbi:MAG TPA: nucleotide exchange factor GrpE [Candidatus Aminicenantes bacterium]|nr:nucleotide exchange factor GrpE [Candidatus Aminicenantes bacterium]
MTDDKDRLDDEIEFIPEAPPPGEEALAAPPSAGTPEAEAKAPAAEAAKGHKDRLRRKDAEIKRLQKELDELKETYLRKLADMENLRKRFERERSEYQQYALSGLLLELLEVADNFERALSNAPAAGDGRALREGVELILRMFQGFLAKNGVRPIVIENRAFDPAYHHAMAVEESEEAGEPEIVEELQKGYMHHDRLLRPALVKVRVPKKG